MGTDRSTGERLRTWGRVWIDALTYAMTVAFVTTVLAVALGLVTGGGLVHTKYALFFAGFLLLGYATLRLWPTSPEDLERGSGTAPGGSMPEVANETRFQRFVQALPPLRWTRAPDPERRMTTHGKLLVGSFFVLLVSYLMEAVFGF